MIRWKYDRLALAIIIWVFYTALYGITKNSTYLHPFNGYLALIGEAGLDLVCAVLAFGVIRKSTQPEKLIIQLFAFSFLFGVISDGSYNIILNIMGIDSFSPVVETIFDFPFAAFLLLQTIAWFLVFRIIYQKNKHHLRGLIFLPFLISGVAILLTFFLMPTWKVSFFSTEGIYNIIDTLLEVASFAVVVICLFSAKDKKFTLLASGYLIVIASDFVIRFSEVEKILFPGSPLETTWVLGLLIFSVGLIRLKRSVHVDLRNSLGDWNSLKVQIGYWLFTSSLTSIFILLLINCVFSNLDIRNMHDIPATLIVFAVLSALVSHVISAYLIRPFKHLNDIVYIYSHRDFSSLDKPIPRIQIEEFKELENCLYDGLKAIKNQTLIERNYFESVLQYSNEVRDPVSAIRMLADNIDELPGDKKSLLINTANKISEITDGLLDKLALTHKNAENITSEQLVKYHSDVPIIMVDDDKNLAMAWEMDAANVGIDLITYNTPDEFMSAAEGIDKRAIIYIDVNLHSSMSGIELSKWAYEHNFKNLYLITGGDQNQHQGITWIQGIYGKKPPFIPEEG